MGRYKKITLIFCFLGLLFSAAISPTWAKETQPETEKLPQLVHVMQKEGATINMWSIYAREQKQELNQLDQIQKEAERLEAQFPHASWSVKHEKMDISYVGEWTNSKYHTSEKVTLLAYPRKNAYQTYLIYEETGSKWEEGKWNHISVSINKKINSIMPERHKIFACASGQLGDTINFVLSKKSSAILNDLKASPIEADNEKTFTSVSAYTELWRDTIESNGHSMNVQLGIRKVDNQTTVTLGTPIITTEY